MLVNGKLKVINFFKFFYVFELEYNLFSVSIIEKASYLILTKKKLSIFDNKNNITFKVTKIKTSYLVNVPANKKTLVLAFLRLIFYSYIL